MGFAGPWTSLLIFKLDASLRCTEGDMGAAQVEPWSTERGSLKTNVGASIFVYAIEGSLSHFPLCPSGHRFCFGFQYAHLDYSNSIELS